MTEIATVPHRVCVVLRRHPGSIFWLMTCTAFLAGVAGSIIGLAAALIIQLAAAVHVVNHTYQPRKDGSSDGRYPPPRRR